jgi:O-methyltransferase
VIAPAAPSLGLARRAAALVARRVGRMPRSERVRWFGARSVSQAAAVLSTRAHQLARGRSGAWVLVVGGHRPLRTQLLRRLERHGVHSRAVATLDELAVGRDELGRLAAILAAEVASAPITAIARQALSDPELASVPFEYAAGLDPAPARVRRLDEYRDWHFLSPALLADPTPYEIYERSLERFEQKCGLRDYLDLHQLLCSVVEREVPGEVAEFGSYKGHSGWLIAATLEALGSDKPLRLYDTFERFPAEPAGVDHFWSATHEVSFEEVQAKFSGLERVSLVRGEFEETLPGSGLGEVALAYVDCDSHRAVSYLGRTLYERHLAPGGVLVFEDYGHPALLGARVAVHELFDGRRDCLRLFSQFSGIYVVVKLDG